MKFFPYYMVLAIAFGISLFFACSADLELPVDPDHFVEQGPQGYCVYDGIEGCFPLENGQCLDGGHKVTSCPNSSSSEEGSSSSAALNNSSSSTGGSSSGGYSSSSSSSSGLIPPPKINDGFFGFRNFDYDSSGSKIYFLKTNNMYESHTEDGNSKFFNTLDITNKVEAKCDSIKTEVTGLKGYTSMPIPPTPAVVDTVGKIIAYAVVTCNGKKDTLATDTAMVVDDPVLVGDCPSLPLHVAKGKKEFVEGISLKDNYGRCGAVNYTLGGTSSPDSITISNIGPSGTQSLSIVAGVSCSSTPSVTVAPKQCPTSVFVADRYIGVVTCGETAPNTFTLSTGTNLFEFRCKEEPRGKPNYWIECQTKGMAKFQLDAEGFESVSSSQWSGANLPGDSPPIEKDDYFYYPKRVLATVTVGSTQNGCTSW